ncbi:DUF1993 domain-containing protein [Ferrovibrio terrae]|uniref:DUF1993 domain-containing protein n=1 Tax=Ferrovibrio terrae TaxID=2594003 RepID=A0A516H6J2_9PROT|nr:DUF1993 domain-containing protein [Ferrovibrio terrae]QDO99345.1 DUF1993 domain-containing protein [Ferrovibrio terrae]
MSLSMYQASVPVFARGLSMLSKLLTKAEAHAAANGLSPADLLEARLAPDMYALTRQIQAACDAAKFGAARPAGITPPSHPDTETSFAELQARIKAVLDFVNGIGEAAFEGAETRAVALKTGSGELSFTGQDYLTGFALPNFFFHAVTAYDILRHKGLPLVKRDFLNLG